MKNLNLILLVGFFALSCAVMFGVSYGFRMVKMTCFIEPELTAATLFLICFAALKVANDRLNAKNPIIPTNELPVKNGEGTSSEPATPLENPENTKLADDLAAAKRQIENLEAGLAMVEKEREDLKTKRETLKIERDSLKNEKDLIQQERDRFKNERDMNEKYFICLDKRYDDLLETARIINEKDPAEITRLWRILISLGLHQYDYMKKICDDGNWRPEQAANIRLVLDEINVGALKKEEYKIYTDDPRYLATDFRVLRRRLRELGIEQLEDVLISGVRI
jgi:hypothetical protein